MDIPLITVLAVLLSLIIPISCGDDAESRHRSRVKRVANGNLAEVTEFPFAVFINWIFDHTEGQRLRYTCTGAIVHSRWVLTAASCFADLIAGQFKQGNETMIFEVRDKMTLRAGTVEGWAISEEGAQEVAGMLIYVHQYFTRFSTMYDADIALIFTKQEWDLTSTGPSPYRAIVQFSKNLPRHGIVLSAAEFGCKVVGWGLRMNSEKKPGFNEGEWVVAPDLVTNRMERFLHSYHVQAGGARYCELAQVYLKMKNAGKVDGFFACAKSTNEVDGQHPCWGDTGAALMCDGKLAGVLAKRQESVPCGGIKSFGYFTSVGHPEVYNWLRYYMGTYTPVRLKFTAEMFNVTMFSNYSLDQ